MIIKKIHDLLTKKQKTNLYLLLVFAVIGMILEVVSVGLILPILSFMIEGSSGYIIIKDILESVFGKLTYKESVLWVIFIFLIIHILKSVFMIFLSWVRSAYLSDIRVYFSKLMFSGYIGQSYRFHLSNNSAKLIHTIKGDVKSFGKGLELGVILVSDFLVLIGLVGLLVWAEPVGAVVVIALLAFIGYILHLLSSKRLERWGDEYRKHAVKGLQHLQQGFGAVKEIKLLGREAELKRRFNYHNKSAGRIDVWKGVISAIPRIGFELIVVISMSALIMIMVVQDKKMVDMLAVLGLFAVAAFRLMPVVSRIFSSFQNLKFLGAAVENLYSDMQCIKNSKNIDKIEQKPECYIGGDWRSLSFNNIYYRYHSNESYALSSVNFSIDKGRVIGLIGGSGAGKSTFVDVLLGLLIADKGEVLLDGIDVHRNIRSWQNQIGYVPQDIYLSDDTLRNNIAFGVAEEDIDDKAVDEVIKAAELEDYILSLSNGIGTVVGENGAKLSGGQKQRIGIARALYHNPSVIVLDEPTSALDIKTEEKVMDSIIGLAGEKTLLIVAHRLSTISRCDNIIVLNDGRIVDEGKYSEVVKSVINVPSSAD